MVDNAINFTAHVWITSGTGITHSHVKYLQGAGAAKSFFTGKSKFDFDTSAIRGFVAMYAENVQAIHLPGNLQAFADCDFICYENKDEGIFWVNKIENLENVNQNTTRIHFSPDYWHTWIEKVTFGQCLVERRHLTDMSDPYISLTAEEISVPMSQRVFTLDQLEKDVLQIWNTNSIYVYLTTDHYNNANNPEVEFQYIGGAPFFGVVRKCTGFDDASNYVKGYLNNNGITQTSVLPVLSNLQRMVIIPDALMTPGAITGFAQEGAVSLPIPASKFGKVYAPQFCRGNIVCLGSGGTTEIDLTRLNFSNGVATLKYALQGCGGIYPKLRACFYQFNETWGNLFNSNTSVVDLCDFPEIPINAFLAPRPTTYGAISHMVDTAFGGNAMGQSSTAQNAAEMGVNKITRRAVPGGLSGGAKLAGPWGATLGAGKGFLDLGNFGHTNYVRAGATPEMNIAQFLYRYEAVMTLPTPDGLAILEDYFNSYGYKIMRREVLQLKYGNNFTFIKLAEPATQVTPNIPHVAFNEISRLLMGGLTIWAADIGTAKEYT